MGEIELNLFLDLIFKGHNLIQLSSIISKTRYLVIDLKFIKIYYLI